MAAHKRIAAKALFYIQKLDLIQSMPNVFFSSPNSLNCVLNIQNLECKGNVQPLARHLNRDRCPVLTQCLSHIFLSNDHRGLKSSLNFL